MKNWYVYLYYKYDKIFQEISNDKLSDIKPGFLLSYVTIQFVLCCDIWMKMLFNYSVIINSANHVIILSVICFSFNFYYFGFRCDLKRHYRNFKEIPLKTSRIWSWIAILIPITGLVFFIMTFYYLAHSN